eukprot:m.473577 g.473577  ORF g.473577 m.473577 type:complete len:129 (-) comp21664_c0_seq42:2844-3230(-)
MLNTKGSIIYVLFLIQIHFADSARTGLQKICTNASGAVRAAMAHAPVELTGLVWDASAPQRIRRQALPEPSRGMHPMYMTALFVSVDARGVAMGDERSHNRDCSQKMVLPLRWSNHFCVASRASPTRS